MKIKIYIVTYNDSIALNSNIASLLSVNKQDHFVEINIINNHSNFLLNEEFHSKVNILHNNVRPDFSRGHLSRNWNQAIINGFRDLKNPDCDIVIGCQDDTVWNKNSILDLLEIHKKYSFYSCSFGDGFWSATAEAIQKIGLWDERFCAITFQEADYFLRAIKYNREKTSINDEFHSRVFQKTKSVVSRPNGNAGRDHGHYTGYVWTYTNNLFRLKWNNINPVSWNDNNMNNIPDCQIQNFVLYPYFEKDIDMTDKNYHNFYINS